MNLNEIPKKHFGQFLGEIGFKGTMNVLSKTEIQQEIFDLQKEIFETQPGEMIALYTQEGFLPYYGIVENVYHKSEENPTDENLVVIVFENETSIQRITILESDIKEDNTVIPIPASRKWLYKTRNILQNSQLTRTNKFMKNNKGISNYVIGSLESDAMHLASILNLPLPTEVKTKDELEKIKDILAELPGRDDEIFDTHRGYCGWGPFEDYATTKEIETYNQFVEFLKYENYRILDFYFKFDSECTECPSCAGSGINRDYGELHENFYDHNSGRWSGWGQKLTQEEVDLLTKEGRLNDLKKVYGENIPAEMVNTLYRARAEEQKRIAGITWIGHDAINVYIVTKLRAQNLGISLEKCKDCDGSGRVNLTMPKLSLACWVGCPEEEIDLIIDLKDLPFSQLDHFKNLSKEHGQKMFEHLTALKNGTNLKTSLNILREAVQTTGWNSDMVYDNWDDFESQFGGRDLDLNVTMGYAFYHPDENAEINHIPKGPMNMFMARPRKGCIATARIKHVSEEDREKIIKFLEQDMITHKRHFKWTDI